MRVLIIAQYFPPDMGGGASRAYNVARGLSIAGCDVIVVTAFPHYPSGNIPAAYKKRLLTVENHREFKVIRTFVPPLASKGIGNRILLFSAFVFSSLLAIPLIKKVDVVWAANPNIIAVFPSTIYRVASSCIAIQNVDDLWPEALYDLGLNSKSVLAKLSELVARFAYRLSSGITPISPAYVRVLSQKYGVPSRKISVVLAGVDVAKFFFRRKPVEKKTECFRILYIGAFSPAYDFDQVFRAAAMLDAFPNIEFLIQGGGELANELKRKAKAASLKNVVVVDKIVNRDEVANIMAEADALLLPLNGVGSIEMGISSKIYEYQAAGKPILCCSNGQPGLYVSKSKSGIVIKPGDSKMLVEAIMFLIENPRAAQELGLSGRKYVVDNVTIDRIGFLMKKFFKEIESSSKN